MLAIIPRAFRWAALFLSFNSLALSQQASVADVLEHSSLTLPSRLSLPEAERLLAARSLAATANRFQLQASLAARTIAGYKPNPTLQIGGEQVPVRSPIPGSAPRLFSTNPDAGGNPVYTALLTKLIERGRKRELRVEQADAQIGAARAQIEDTLRTQLFQLRQAFTAALLAQENLRVAEQISHEYQQTQHLTEVRVKAGDVALVEEYRVRAGRLPFEQALVQSRAAYDAAVRDIMNLLAAPQSSGAVVTRVAAAAPVSNVPDVDGTLDTGPVLSDPVQLRALALENRADVRIARANLRAAEKGTQLAEAQRRRDVVVGVEYQRVGEDDSVGVTAQIPLFTYNNQKLAVAQSRAQQRVAEAQLRAVEFQVVTDVEKAWQLYLASQRALQLYNGSAVSDMGRVRTITQYSYQKGEANLFELLEVQRNYNQTLLGYNQARADYLNRHWQLEQAVGSTLP